ncbi:MAG: MerR family transcriptional regulator [Sphaerochaeta sp.]|uniref:MerR family transcriptional regulator n=1 Tax=Sphaerochaeta sp. TaxID=1972642 RepID=UPI003D0A53A7
MKDFFTIGELATLFGVDVQTLRYYDSIGLLVPVHRDAKTGYRLYKFDQIYQVASIRYLKRLGYSLEQIKKYLDSRTLDHTIEQLKDQSLLLRRRYNELMEIDSAIQRKLEFIKQQLPSVDLAHVMVKTFSDRYYLNIGSEESLYGSDVFYFHPTLVFYQGKEKRFGAFLFEYQGGSHLQTEVMRIKAGSFLCAYHQGPYELIGETTERIRLQANGRLLADWEVNFNILDQFVERDNTRFITEIQIPILDDPHLEI